MAFTVKLGFVSIGVGDWRNEMSRVLKIAAVRQLLSKINKRYRTEMATMR